MNTERRICRGNASGVEKFGRRGEIIACIACIQMIQFLIKVAGSHLLKSVPAVRATTDEAFWHHLVGISIFTSLSKIPICT